MSVERPANTDEQDRETFPQLKADIGEDPARWLDQSDPSVAYPRIRGITDLGVLRAWRAVERRIDRGPRREVLSVIADQEARLEEQEVTGE